MDIQNIYQTLGKRLMFEVVLSLLSETCTFPQVILANKMTYGVKNPSWTTGNEEKLSDDTQARDKK